MKQWIWAAVLMGCASTGCVTLPSLADKPEAKPPETPGTVRPEVQPDQVNNANARQMAAALVVEMDAAQTDAKPAQPAEKGR
jgi:hypothetical protein